MPTLTVPCQPALLMAVESAAAARGMAAGRLVAATLLVTGTRALDALPDPGEPERSSLATRTVTLASGRSRRVRVVPKLRVRVAEPVDHATVRKGAWVAATLGASDGACLVTTGELAAMEMEVSRGRVRLEQLTAALETLAFRPLRQPIRKSWQATYVMGFTHEWGLDEKTITTRFRSLAPIFHPDTGLLSSAERMSQLLEARNFLLESLRG